MQASHSSSVICRPGARDGHTRPHLSGVMALNLGPVSGPYTAISASFTASSMSLRGSLDMVTSSVAVEPPIWHGLVTVVGRRPSGRLDEGRVDRASRHQQDITE